MRKAVIVTESENDEINTEQGKIILTAAPEFLSRQNSGFDS